MPHATRPPEAPPAAQPPANAPLVSTASLTESLRTQFAAAPPAADTETPRRGDTETPATPVSEVPVAPAPEIPASPSLPVSASAPPPAAPADPDDDQSQWPPSAIGVVTAIRAERRELKAELKAEREAREKLQAELSASPRLPVSASSPAADDLTRGSAAPLPPELAALQERETQQTTVANWCRQQLRAASRNPEAAAAALAAAQITLPDNSPEAVTEWLETARDAALDQAAALRTERQVRQNQVHTQETAMRAQAEAFVRKTVPELNTPNHARAVKYQQALDRFPSLKTLPDGPLLALISVLGEEALTKLVKPAGPPAPVTPPPPPPPPTRGPRPAASVTPPAPGSQRSTDLFKAFVKSGKPADREAWLKASLAEA